MNDALRSRAPTAPRSGKKNRPARGHSTGQEFRDHSRRDLHVPLLRAASHRAGPRHLARLRDIGCIRHPVGSLDAGAAGREKRTGRGDGLPACPLDGRLWSAGRPSGCRDPLRPQGYFPGSPGPDSTVGRTVLGGWDCRRDSCRTVVDAAFRIESLRDPGLSGSGCLCFPLCLDSGAGGLCSGPRPSGNPYRRVVGGAISGRSTFRSRPVGILLCTGSGGPVPVAGSTSQEQRLLLRTLFCALWTGSLLPGRASGR